MNWEFLKLRGFNWNKISIIILILEYVCLYGCFCAINTYLVTLKPSFEIVGSGHLLCLHRKLIESNKNLLFKRSKSHKPCLLTKIFIVQTADFYTLKITSSVVHFSPQSSFHSLKFLPGSSTIFLNE